MLISWRDDLTLLVYDGGSIELCRIVEKQIATPLNESQILKPPVDQINLESADSIRWVINLIISCSGRPYINKLNALILLSTSFLIVSYFICFVMIDI